MNTTSSSDLSVSKALSLTNKKLLLLLLAGLFSVSGIQGQTKVSPPKLDFNLEPGFGEATIHNRTIETEPYIVAITSGGVVNSAYVGGECTGFVSEAPDIRIMWNGSLPQLVFYFSANEDGEDTTILVNLPDGTWLCNDDGFEGTLNPLVVVNDPENGQYDIWVGSYREEEYIEGTL